MDQIEILHESILRFVMFMKENVNVLWFEYLYEIFDSG